MSDSTEKKTSKRNLVWQFQDYYLAALFSGILLVILLHLAGIPIRTAAVIVLALLLVMLTLYLRHISLRLKQLQHEVKLLRQGHPETEITISENNEITDLAEEISQLRLQLISQKQETERMEQAQYKLITGMAHDLRNPLTSLMSYLEILRKQESAGETVTGYTEKAYRKALEIRAVSDQLFEYFLIRTDKNTELECTDIEIGIGEYLSELWENLSQEGFRITLQNIKWKKINIDFNHDYMGRIINNLVSNIMKYADPAQPVLIRMDFQEDTVEAAISNTIRHDTAGVKGTGIGVYNIIMMMEKMNGQCRIEKTAAVYTTRLFFRKNREL